MELREIEAEIARLQKLKVQALAMEQERRARAREEAAELIPELVNLLRRLDKLGFLPQRLADVLTDAEGKVNPGLYLKRPRAGATPHVETTEGDQPTAGSPASPHPRSSQSSEAV